LSQLCISCTKEFQNTHYLKRGGSCNQPTTIKIYDETGGTQPVRISFDSYDFQPANTIENIHFKNYVNTISKYLFTKVDEMGLCQGTSPKPKVELVFVYRPAISRGILPYGFDPQLSKDTKYLDSPWVKLSLSKSPEIKIQGVFFWNERQFLLDQALTLGEPISDIKPLLPIPFETFDRWAIARGGFMRPETIDLKQLPPDIQQLFSRWSTNWKSGREQAIEHLQSMEEEEKIGYTDLTTTLIDRFFTSANIEIKYSDVFDLKNVFDIDKYRIYPYTDERYFKQIKSMLQQRRINSKHP
jgi:hypothetical protein